MIVFSFFMRELPMSRQLLACPKTLVTSFEIARFDTLVSLALLFDL
jgi:hypothetical protein